MLKNQKYQIHCEENKVPRPNDPKDEDLFPQLDPAARWVLFEEIEAMLNRHKREILALAEQYATIAHTSPPGKHFFVGKSEFSNSHPPYKRLIGAINSALNGMKKYTETRDRRNAWRREYYRKQKEAKSKTAD